MVAAILIGSIISLGAMNDAPQKTVSTVTTVMTNGIMIPTNKLRLNVISAL